MSARPGHPDARPGVLILGSSSPLVGGTWTEADRSNTWVEANRVPTWTEPDRGIEWSAPDMATLVKRAGETRLYTMSMALLPEIAGGDTIASVTSILCTSVVSGPGATSDLTLSSKAVTSNSQGGQCKIAGGTDGVTYLLTFTLLTAAGNTLVGIGYLYVDDR